MCAAATRSFKAKHDDIYASEASCRRYDVELCRKQDFADALMREFQTLAPWMSRATTRAADIGCGTGKIARILAPYCHSISATDRSADCIAVARAAAASSSDDCETSFEVADARQLPLAFRQRCELLSLTSGAARWIRIADILREWLQAAKRARQERHPEL